MEQKPTYEELEQKVRTLEQEVDALRQDQAEQSNYRQILEYQPELVCQWLPDTTLTFVNNTFARFLAKTSSELLGLKWIDLISESEKEPIWASIQLLTPEQPVLTNEHYLQRNDGEWRWFEWIDTAMPWRAQRNIGFLA